MSPSDYRQSQSQSQSTQHSQSVLLTPKSSMASLNSRTNRSRDQRSSSHSTSPMLESRPHRLSAHYREEDIDFDVESIQHFRRSSFQSYISNTNDTIGREEGRRLLDGDEEQGLIVGHEGLEEDDQEIIDQERRIQAGVAKIEALYRVFGNNRAAVWTLYAAIAGKHTGGSVVSLWWRVHL